MWGELLLGGSLLYVSVLPSCLLFKLSTTCMMLSKIKPCLLLWVKYFFLSENAENLRLDEIWMKNCLLPLSGAAFALAMLGFQRRKMSGPPMSTEVHVLLKLSATGKSLMVISLLHKMQAPNNCFTLSLCNRNSCKSNYWRDDHVTTHWYRSRWWRSWCHAGDDRDHDSTLEMEIKGARWWWPYHVTYFDCIWCLSFIHLIMLSLTVAF